MADDFLRCIESPPMPPPQAMALDEQLLRSDGPPTLRLYGWQPPGLSLGWFQDATPFEAIEGPHVLVRRPTGGGAIWHEDEITFALTLPAHLLPGPIADSYCLLHGAVRTALARVGVETRLVGGASTARARPRQPWCFAEASAGDLVTEHGKIVGSAQRRLRHPPRILHHGSLPLRRPRFPERCGCVADHVDPDAVATFLRQALIEELARALHLCTSPGPFFSPLLPCPPSRTS